MTAATIARLRVIDAKLAAYEAALEATLLGAESASIATAGNSQSYKRWDPAKLQTAMDRLRRERAALVRGAARLRTSPDFA